MTQSTRERAARALYEREPIFYHPSHPPFKIGQMPWEEADEGWRAPYFARVDTVLDEIREPSEAMIGAMPATGDRALGGRWATICRDVWRAGIDAIKRGEG